MRTFVRIFAASIVMSAVVALAAQQPEILHAQGKTQTVDHGLSAVLVGLKAQKGTTWVGYSIAVKERISSGPGSNHSKETTATTRKRARISTSRY
jgi:hypothetical protein